MSLPSNRFRPVPSHDIEMDVVVDHMDESGEGGGVASFLSGYAIYKDQRFPFEAVAYGRIGGQNVSPTLTLEAVDRLEKLSVDLEVFTSVLQRKLVEGELTVKVPENMSPPE